MITWKLSLYKPFFFTRFVCTQNFALISTSLYMVCKLVNLGVLIFAIKLAQYNAKVDMNLALNHQYFIHVLLMVCGDLVHKMLISFDIRNVQSKFMIYDFTKFHFIILFFLVISFIAISQYQIFKWNQFNFADLVFHNTTFRSQPAVRLAEVSINYPMLSICNSAGKNILAEKLAQRIDLLNNRWRIFAPRYHSSIFI